MDLQKFIRDSNDYFDFLESELNKSKLILIGIGNPEYLQKTRELWQLMDKLGKKKAEYSYSRDTRCYFFKFRNIKSFLEICFEGKETEFYKVNKASNSKNIFFDDPQKFIDLDTIIQEDECYEVVRPKVEEVIFKLQGMNVPKDKIKNIISNIVKEILNSEN